MSTPTSSRKGPALGRGLGALLSAPTPAPDDAPEAGAEARPVSPLYQFEERVRYLGRVAEIDIDHIRPNPYQPRKHFDETALEELAASIRQLGIIQPVTVRAMGAGRFEIISGERRLRASRRAGLRRIPAFVREADTEAMLEMAIVENVQREALNPVEVALGYQRLIEECGLNQEAVAAKVGKNRTTVTNYLRLLRLPPRVQAALRDGTLSAGHARALVSLDDAEAQVRIMVRTVDEGLSVRDVEDLVRAARDAHGSDVPAADPAAPAPPPAPSREDLVLQQFADRLRGRLATHVAIKHKGPQGGRIEIAYYSNDDLERLLGILEVKE